MPPENLNVALYLRPNSTAASSSSLGLTPGALLRPLPPTATQVSHWLATHPAQQKILLWLAVRAGLRHVGHLIMQHAGTISSTAWT
jgi:hypothetical protein